MNRLINTVLLVAAFMCAGTAFAGSDEDLMKKAKEALGPLPASMPSEENPLTDAKVKLGKILYYEARISIDGTVSCAKCHPISLYAVDGLRKAVGNNCRPNPRNSPTILNAAGQISAHWNGNRKNVEDQAKQALIGPPSFGMPSYEAVEKKLSSFKEYRELFASAFPGTAQPVTADNFAKAVGAFERTLVTPSPFDAFLKGKKDALTESQKKGLQTFLDRGCAGCHSGPFVGGQLYRKFGVLEPYAKYTKSMSVDTGRYEVTKKDEDLFVFKVPVLRNVEKTSPYFHDGSVDSLGDAVGIMAKIQLGKDLSGQEISDITAFLASLTGGIPEEVLRVPLLPSE
jgi:cytochrome c peroxidase